MMNTQIAQLVRWYAERDIHYLELMSLDAHIRRLEQQLEQAAQDAGIDSAALNAKVKAARQAGQGT